MTGIGLRIYEKENETIYCKEKYHSHELTI